MTASSTDNICTPDGSVKVVMPSGVQMLSVDDDTPD